MPVSRDSEDELQAEPQGTSAAGVAGGWRRPEEERDPEVMRARLAVEAAENAVTDLEGKIAVLELKEAATDADESAPPWRRKEAAENVASARRAFKQAGLALARAQDEADEALSNYFVALTRAPADESPEEEQPPQPRFATVDLFVERFVLPNFVHKVSQRVRWCPMWWEHAEAITRLEAIWEAFEVMRLLPPPSLSTWLRDHFDVHMSTLTDPEGVFFNCDWERGFHKAGDPWPNQAPPEGMFQAIESAQIQRAAVAGAMDLTTTNHEPHNIGAAEQSVNGVTR